MKYYLAIDIGASGGRHILGYIENGKLMTEEIYRFENGIVKTDKGNTWDIEILFKNVLEGIKRCHTVGKAPATVAIDTWGVDYVLLGENKELLSPVFSYRDETRKKIVPEVEKILPHSKLYEKTGIQFQPFNTVYQLYCDKVSGKLDSAAYFMQIPDYLAYRLTGVVQNEYTNATTTSLVNAHTKTWDAEILEKLGLKASLFQSLTPPATKIGAFSPEITQELGFSADVIACPTHDTASAFAATLGIEDGIILSSGTWSLIGTEQTEPITNETAKEANFTNEGGIEYRYRFLKNIMGMWLIQSIRRDTGKKHSYNELMEMAKASSFTKTFDVNHPTLAAPDNMVEAITKLLGYDTLPLGDLLASVYRSLALSYKIAKDNIEDITGKHYTSLQIVGGGSSDAYLNHLTKEITGLRVLTGPKEATAIGNLISQVICDKALSLKDARIIVKDSFDVKEAE